MCGKRRGADAGLMPDGMRDNMRGARRKAMQKPLPSGERFLHGLSYLSYF